MYIYYHALLPESFATALKVVNGISMVFDNVTLVASLCNLLEGNIGSLLSTELVSTNVTAMAMERNTVASIYKLGVKTFHYNSLYMCVYTSVYDVKAVIGTQCS